MTRQRFPYLGIIATSMPGLAIVASGSSKSPSAKSANATPDPSGYRLLKKITLGGEGGWDYITFDSPTRRLFISRQTKVIVLAVDSEKVVGEIPKNEGVHGIALAPEVNRGFTSNGRAHTVTIFDIKTISVNVT